MHKVKQMVKDLPTVCQLEQLAQRYDQDGIYDDAKKNADYLDDRLRLVARLHSP